MVAGLGENGFVMNRYRVLLVEDDPSWQQILGEIIVDMELEVDFASSSQEVLPIIRQQSHKVAILDLSLGGTDHRNQDGLEVAEIVRRHDPTCAIIFLTGFATVELAVKVMRDLNAVSCLRKEVFRRSEFRELINQVLQQPPSNSSMQRSESRELAGEKAEDAEENGGQNSPDHPLALVVEDDAGWRSLLTELLEEAGYQVIISTSYVEAIAFIKRDKIALSVLDLSLSSSLPQDNFDGYRLLTSMNKAGIPAIVVSGYVDSQRIERAYADGLIIACLEKQSFEKKSFEQAILAAQSFDQVDPIIKTLTDREREVLALLAQGMTNKEIASRLTITSNTVKRHLKSLFTKLNVNTRSAASARAITLRINRS